MKIVRRWIRVALAGLAAGAGLLPAAGASPARCEALQALVLDGARVVQARHHEAGRFTPPQGAAFAVGRPYCRVQIAATPTPTSDIRIEVWLPDAARWNGRFWGLGNGSFGGQISHRGLAVRVAGGYAVVATDTGHQADPSASQWALGQPEKVRDYGHRSVHLAALLGKQAATAYFGRQPAHAYFSAYSNGGRQALMLAQRYPDDYDGIIAGAPATDLTGLYAGAADFLSGMAAAPQARLSAAQTDLLAAAVRASCDTLDGVRDGVLENPLRCRFDPAALACTVQAGPACLSPEQVAGVRRLYRGWSFPGGGPPAGGLAPGSESGWLALLLGDGAAPAELQAPVTGFFRHLVLDAPDWALSQWRADGSTQGLLQRAGRELDATEPDIGRFVARGGKLLLWHGWNDAVVSPTGALAYHARVVRTLGPQAAVRAVRLFMAPGVEHGLGGPGPDRFGQFAGGDGDPDRSLGAAMRRWVEQGVPPERVIAVRHRTPGDASSGVARSRPLCAWPKVAVYRGAGSTDDEQSFDCALAERLKAQARRREAAPRAGAGRPAD